MSSTSTRTTWADLVKASLGPKGYHIKLRRCLQSVVLYEALRCVEPLANAGLFRHCERKHGFLRQVEILVQKIDCLTPADRDEVLWRTGTARLRLDADIAWRRAKSVEKEMQKLATQIKPFLAPNRSHQESVDLMIRQLHDKQTATDKAAAAAAAAGADDDDGADTAAPTSTADAEAPPPPTAVAPTATPASIVPLPAASREWEAAHNHVLMAFRLYYCGDKPDPTFPPPDDSVLITAADLLSPPSAPAPAPATTPNVAGTGGTATGPSTAPSSPLPPSLTYPGRSGPPPANTPPTAGTHHQYHHQHHPAVATFHPPHHGASHPYHAHHQAHDPVVATAASSSHASAAAAGAIAAADDWQRRRVLGEVREHLEILREFQGVVPDEEIDRRKRELFQALPPPPPPALSAAMGTSAVAVAHATTTPTTTTATTTTTAPPAIAGNPGATAATPYASSSPSAKRTKRPGAHL